MTKFQQLCSHQHTVAFVSFSTQRFTKRWFLYRSQTKCWPAPSFLEQFPFLGVLMPRGLKPRAHPAPVLGWGTPEPRDLERVVGEAPPGSPGSNRWTGKQILALPGPHSATSRAHITDALVPAQPWCSQWSTVAYNPYNCAGRSTLLCRERSEQG